MKKINVILFFLSLISLSVAAQSKRETAAQVKGNTAQVKGNSTVSAQEISNAIKDCHELDSQLNKLFGSGYTMETPGVKEQLQKNIADATLSRCVRKSSLKAFYGTDYVNKLHLIETTNIKQ